MSSLSINDPEVLSEVRAAFERYEKALLRHDVETLNALFWDHADCVRYGAADHQHGIAALKAWRAGAAAVHPQRGLRNTVIASFGRDTASVCTEFTAPDTPLLGRQSQTWVRFGALGWRIVAAHVSLVDPTVGSGY
jgi:hypothetical protein